MILPNIQLLVKNLIYRATAAQTEYYVLNGENYNDDDSDNVKIGKYSYGGSGSKSTGAVQICPRALMFFRAIRTNKQSCRSLLWIDPYQLEI